MGKKVSNPTIARVVTALRRQGWTVTATNKGHYRFVPQDPSQPAVVCSGTPGDVRAVRNLFSRLRRSGADMSGLAR